MSSKDSYRFKGTKGNLASTNKGNHQKTFDKRAKSTKGYYEIAFTEPFSRLTERDLELKQEYAKDAVGRYYGIHKRFVQLRKKSSNVSGVNLDEVYYVMVGQQPVGKIAIRIKRLTKTNAHMVLAYQHKREVPRRDVKSKFVPIRTEREQRRVEKKRQRTNRKGDYKSTR